MMRIGGWSEAEEVSGDWRKFRNEELHVLYSALNIITMVIDHRTVRWTGHVARGVIEIYLQDVSGRPERKRLYGKHRSRWDIFIIKVDLKTIRRKEAEWINLAWNSCQSVPFVTTVMNTRIP
jgi:hypothetical protein